jgi:hypothetical protein
MKQNKLVIVVLVVIAVLFVIGLSSGLFRENGKKDDELTMSKADTLDDRWLVSLAKRASPFRDPLDRRRLAERSNCQVGDRTYKLNDGNICEITIAPSEDAEKVENAVLTVADNNATLKVAYPTLDVCPASRGMKAPLKKMKTSKMTIGVGKIKHPVPQKDASPAQLELVVLYLPNEKGKKHENFCRTVDKVEVAVLRTGGKIQMRCRECMREPKMTVGVNLK